MKYFSINIDENHFKKQYIIYIIEIFNGKDVLLYVGQTGDRNYKTARPAFRRLGGHFSDQGYSTQNQVYRAIAVKVLGFQEAKNRKKAFTDEIKNSVSDYISNCKVRMHVYPIEDYSFIDDLLIHKNKLQSVEQIERYLIKILEETNSNYSILNLNKPKPKGSKSLLAASKSKALKILEHLSSNMVHSE